jgi:hypothetical protein
VTKIIDIQTVQLFVLNKNGQGGQIFDGVQTNGMHTVKVTSMHHIRWKSAYQSVLVKISA